MGSKSSSLRKRTKSKKPRSSSNSSEDKAKLIFVRTHCDLYHCLSLNISREICEYLSDPQLLLVNIGPQIYQFNPASKQFTPIFEVTSVLGRGCLITFTFMGPDDVFMVLRNSFWMIEDSPYFATYISEKVVDLGYRDDRPGCAVIYDPSADCVYIFGGQNSGMMLMGEFRKRSERFRVSNSKFEPLPDMLRARSWLGCCWHNRLVFLCGGGHSSVETFNPIMEKFFEYSELDCDPERETGICAVSSGDELIIVSISSVWRGRDTQLIKIKENVRSQQPHSISGTSVLWANSLYCISYCGCTAIDLESGEKTEYLIAQVS